MSSPRTIEAGASRASRIVAGIIAAFLLACLPGVAISGLASAEDHLKESKQELHATKDKMRARLKKIRNLQRHMNALATRISRSEREILQTEARIDKLARQMLKLQVRASLLQAQLDERNRQAYISGGTPILYLLTATSAAEAASRMSFLTEMNRRDAVLAGEVREATDRLARVEAEVVRARQIVELTQRRLEMDREKLHRKMAESQRLVESLRGRIEQIQYEISKIRPFAACPVDGPHAIADDFGIKVFHPKKEGGNHIHQGNDIYAAMGVPIVAPFDGTAVSATNPIGGLAVKVYGDFGYVYNAHLSRFGTLGPVQHGDVIGYVGATGNAGGPHDHFEWHPGNGNAVDPHEYLLMVCESGPLPF
jgi:murein DD-endopeptidase MepM/ murein hydrolase activator NlpD